MKPVPLFDPVIPNPMNPMVQLDPEVLSYSVFALHIGPIGSIGPCGSNVHVFYHHNSFLSNKQIVSILYKSFNYRFQTFDTLTGNRRFL